MKLEVFIIVRTGLIGTQFVDGQIRRFVAGDVATGGVFIPRAIATISFSRVLGTGAVTAAAGASWITWCALTSPITDDGEEVRNIDDAVAVGQGGAITLRASDAVADLVPVGNDGQKVRDVDGGIRSPIRASDVTWAGGRKRVVAGVGGGQRLKFNGFNPVDVWIADLCCGKPAADAAFAIFRLDPAWG